MATATRKTKTGEDALTLLKHDHDEVKKLFSQFEKAKESAKQLQLCQQVCMELTIHAQIEEQSFYPEVRKLPDLEDMVLESLEEHRQAKELIAKLQGMRAGDDHLEPDMKVLKEDIEHHVQEEEKDMFPKVKKAMGNDRLEQMGKTLKRQKTSMKTEMMPAEQRLREEVREPSRATTR
jgi:hemerythrin superfamily protein